jgi:hypothetical protein
MLKWVPSLQHGTSPCCEWMTWLTDMVVENVISQPTTAVPQLMYCADGVITSRIQLKIDGRT